MFDDGKQVLSCSADSTLMVWDVASGQSTKALLGHKDLVDRCSVFVKNGITYGAHASLFAYHRLRLTTRAPPLC